MPTRGRYPRSSRAFVTSASEWRMSPDRGFSKSGLISLPAREEMKFARPAIVTRLPHAMLMTSPTAFVATQAARFASMMLSMYVKSRDCFPSP